MFVTFLNFGSSHVKILFYSSCHSLAQIRNSENTSYSPSYNFFKTIPNPMILFLNRREFNKEELSCLPLFQILRVAMSNPTFVSYFCPCFYNFENTSSSFGHNFHKTTPNQVILFLKTI